MNPLTLNPLALLAGGALAVAIGFGAGWKTNGWRLGERISDMQQAQTAAALEFEAKARQREQEFNDKLQEAQNASKEREKNLLATADRARTESDRLRNDLTALRRQLPDLTDAAVRKYADAASIVFDECQRRYSELAATADRIDNDRQTLMEAWPK